MYQEMPGRRRAGRRRVDACGEEGDISPVNPTWRDLLIWGGGALAVVLAVLAWLWLTTPADNPLPGQYRYGVM
jgi:hypothetical protein